MKQVMNLAMYRLYDLNQVGRQVGWIVNIKFIRNVCNMKNEKRNMVNSGETSYLLSFMEEKAKTG